MTIYFKIELGLYDVANICCDLKCDELISFENISNLFLLRHLGEKKQLLKQKM